MRGSCSKPSFGQRQRSYAMACRITDDVINALQHCRLKAYFRLRGEEGVQCGYEKLLIEQRANSQRDAIEKIRREYSETEVATDLDLSVTNLRKGAALILCARLDDDRHAVVFDGLRKTNGPSTLGDFRYQPVMFCATGQIRASDRQQLAARAVLLARVQGALPDGGVIYTGRDSTSQP
jgi:predicted RecB family nuclease